MHRSRGGRRREPGATACATIVGVPLWDCHGPVLAGCARCTAQGALHTTALGPSLGLLGTKLIEKRRMDESICVCVLRGEGEAIGL